MSVAMLQFMPIRSRTGQQEVDHRQDIRVEEGGRIQHQGFHPLWIGQKRVVYLPSSQKPLQLYLDNGTSNWKRKYVRSSKDSDPLATPFVLI